MTVFEQKGYVISAMKEERTKEKNLQSTFRNSIWFYPERMTWIFEDKQLDDNAVKQLFSSNWIIFHSVSKHQGLKMCRYILSPER